MSFSQGKYTESSGFSNPVIYTTTTNGEQSLDSDRVFDLLSNLLPLEICIHYQVLPLKLKHQRLVLGMVNPKDNDALEYVNRIVSYLNCTIDIRTITAHTHQEILSAYLRYQNTTGDNYQIQEPEIVEEAEYPHHQQQESIQTHYPEVDAEADIPPIESIEDENPTFTPTIEVEIQATHLQDSTTVLQSSTISEVREKLPKNLPVLSLPRAEELHPIDVLPTLPPKQLLTQLLGRVVTKGIGRLYLKRYAYEGQIIWSNNGVPQCVLEKLPLSTYQGVLNELKRFGGFSLTTIDELKQVETEYLHQNNSLLIRLRIIPEKYGEEATLQVLKGTALQFYRQKQIERLSNDSLRLTQSLSRKLHQLQDRLLLSSNSSPEKLTSLDKLDKLLNNLDYQIKMLTIPSEG
ncbi:MAG: pilus assembly protein PilB [Calothrix sp. MO_167.B42]|nr:pilus assembly protein PilB [Calothrix sp. MO_167.B42]